ncbi:MAG: serpin family protein [Polyangiaceae bacterium]
MASAAGQSASEGVPARRVEFLVLVCAVCCATMCSPRRPEPPQPPRLGGAAPGDAGPIDSEASHRADAEPTAGKDAGTESALAERPVVPPSLARAVNLFARDLHGEVTKQQGSLFYSPLSVAVALTMAYGGAAGRTGEEIGKALHLDAAGIDAHAEYAELFRRLRSEPREGAPELRIANRLWADKKASLLPEFLALTSDYYDAPAARLDFGADPDAARNMINRWVQTQTRERIRDLLPAGSVDPATQLILTNGIYFKARWVTPFSTTNTTEQPFYVGGLKPRPVPTMSAVLSGRYAKLPDGAAIELPYFKGLGPEVSMVVVLPTKRDGIGAIERRYARGGIDELIASLKTSRIQVSMPRFRAAGRFKLKGALMSLGIREAFGRSADFSRMFSAGARIAITDVFHEAWFETNEGGSEAAAASGVTLGEVSDTATPVVRVDHPFLFAIRDTASGVVLFAGRVMDPG